MIDEESDPVSICMSVKCQAAVSYSHNAVHLGQGTAGPEQRRGVLGPRAGASLSRDGGGRKDDGQDQRQDLSEHCNGSHGE